MARTAQVIYVGDAGSLERASERASVAVASTTGKIDAAGKRASGSFLSMSGSGKKAAEEIEHSTGRIGSAFGGIASSGTLAVAGIAAVAVAVEGLKKSADTVEELSKVTLKLHNLTGLSVETASKYAAVAKVTEINVKGLSTAFITLSKNVHAVELAHDGLTKSAKTQENAFKTLKLPLADVYKAHGDLNKLLPEIVSHFEHLPGSVNKAATAQALFGRGAKELVPLMHAGALGLKEQLEAAEQSGAYLQGGSVKSLKAFAKAQEEAKYASLGLSVAFGQYVAPALTKAIKLFAGFVHELQTGKGPIGDAEKAVESAFNKIESVVKSALGSVGKFLHEHRQTLVAVGNAAEAFGADVADVFNSIPRYVSAAIGAVRGYLTRHKADLKSIEQAAENVAKVMKAVGGAIVWTWENYIYPVVKRTIPAIVDVVKGGFKVIEGLVQVIAGVLSLNFGEAWKGVLNVFKGGVEGSLGILRAATAPFRELASKAFGAIGDAASAALHGIESIVTGVFDEIVSTLKADFNTFYDIGKYLIEGLAKGVEAAASAVFHALGGVVSKGVGLVKGALGIKSPSTVFHEIGMNIGAGLAQGLTAGGGMVSAGVHAGLLAPVADAEKALHAHTQKIGAHLASVSAKAASAATGVYSKSELETLWIKAGGNPASANTAASIALAESRGRASATNLNKNGTTDRGLWQINSIHGAQSTFDPMANARAAVSISNNGTDFQPWVTYNTGAYKAFLAQAAQPSAGAKAQTPKFKLEGKSAAKEIAAALEAHRAHSEVAHYGDLASAISGRLSREQSRWAVTAPPLAEEPVPIAGQRSTYGPAMRHAAKTVSSAKAEKRFFEAELKSLKREMAAWVKARNQYLHAGHVTKDGKQKKEALKKAGAIQAKLDQARSAAKELGGSIYEAETSIEAGEKALAALPGEIASAHEEAASTAAQQASETTSNDLSAYQAANAKVDAEVRAGLKTEQQGKEQKEANARKAETGGYGALSEEGLLQVKGDLRELGEAATSATEALKAHDEALLESSKALLQFAQIANGIGLVEAGSLMKTNADLLNGEIGGIIHGRRVATVGSGSAASY